jgi:fumarate reductase flavoprotein subunit
MSTRRTFIKLLGGTATFFGSGLASRTVSAEAGNAKPQAKKLTTDVAVLGAGPGGLAAALRAAELGLTVCLFEKKDKTGGARNGGMGPFAAGTHIQEKYGVKNCTTKDAFNYLMDFNHWRTDARLASEFINNTAFTVKWLEEQGLLFSPMGEASKAGGGPAMLDSGFMHAFARHPDYPNEGFYACSLLTDRARAKKNIQIFLQTPVRNLIKIGNVVTGLVAQDATGDEIHVKAKAIIIMTGGFSGNPEMIKKYTNFTYKKDLFATFEMPNLSADGMKMAWDVGAVRSEMMMGIYKGIPIYGGPGGTKNEWAILANANLMVNLLGQRFMNEALSDRYMYGNIIHRQPSGCGFMIFDSTIADIYRNQQSDTGLGVPASMGMAPPVHDIEKIVAEATKLNYPYLFAADSIEDLCRQTGIDPDGLKATIAEYNSFCKTSKDSIYYKDSSNLLPLYGPKYYASKWCCDNFGGIGGIKINPKTEVLNTDLKPIPGLYAGGHDANTMYADTYPAYESGNFSSFAYTTGLMAAKNAAEYIKSMG